MFCIKCKTSFITVNKSDAVFTVYCDKCISILKEERCSGFIDETKRLLGDCDICLDSYVHMRQLKFHYCTRDRVYNCHDCGQQLDGRKSMIEHSRIVHQEKHLNKFITCYICWERFATSSSFDIHKATHVKNPLSTHESDVVIGNKNSLLDIHKRTKVDERPYKCNTCERSYATKFSLNRHIKTTHDTSYRPLKSTHDDIAIRNKKHTLDNYIKNSTDGSIHKCSACGRIYFSKSSLRRHMRVHSSDKPYTCTICNKSLLSVSGLIIHMRSHTGEKPYKCKICGKCFSASSALIMHLTIHTGERPFSCTTCERKFSNKYSLVKHIRTHTGEKPYVCNICNKCFSANSALINHLRIHTGERAYKCCTCDKSFSNKYLLDRHMRSHTGERPYSCTTCDKKFSTNSILVVHLRTHTGEKPFKCSNCVREFTNNRSLTRHMTTHTGERSYSSETFQNYYLSKFDSITPVGTDTDECSS